MSNSTEETRPLLERGLGWFLVALMGVSVMNVLWQVFTRFVLSNPSPYTEELARFLLIWIGLIGGAYASGRRLHLAIDLLPERLTGRASITLSIVIELCVAVFAASVLVAGGLRLVSLTLSLGQTSAALRVPLGYVYMALPISGVLFTWFAIANIRRHIEDERPS